MIIFVFGSNLAGRHGKGAALEARLKYGAVYGQGEGFQGMSYAIPTKDEKLRVRSLDDIQGNIVSFVEFALMNPRYIFLLTPIGCGLAGYKQEQILPMFDASMPRNVALSKEWKIQL